MRHPNLLRLLTIFLVALMSGGAATVDAQTETGRISGTVTDPQGGVVPRVTVTATSVDTGVTRSTVTDSNGRYVVANVPPATYDVSFALAGFKTVKKRPTVQVGTDVAVDATLDIGNVTEQVNVVALPDAINVRTGEFKSTITSRQLVELPTLTRNPYDLVSLAGNVHDVPFEETQLVGGVGRGTGFSINGARSASTNILLDGGDNNNQFDTSVGQEVPLDSIQEFSVITNNFSAQYGRATGGIVNLITKSGTNMFSGTAYEFFRNGTLASNTPDNEANGISKGEFRRNQTGYSLGGPIVKDRMHFFSSLEFIGVRSQDALITWVPTPEFLAASNPATRAYFDTYGKGVTVNGPTLTRGQVSAIIGQDTGAFNSLPANLPIFGRVDQPLAIDAGGGDPQNHFQLVEKVDVALGSNTQASIRYAYRNRESDPGTQSASPFALYNTGTSDKDHNINVSVTRVWAPVFTSQSKVVWNRVDNEQLVNSEAQPRLMMNPNGPVRLQGYQIAFPGYFPFTPSSDIPAGGPQKLLQLYQDQTWLTGNHDIRFGGSYVRINDDHTFSAYSNAVQALNTSSNALVSLDNFVIGQIARFQKAINPGGFPGGTFVTPVPFPSFTSFNRYNEYALYAQDNWSIGNRLKLNLGARYEYFGPQLKDTPKFDSNFYWGDPNLDLTTATPQQVIAAVRTGQTIPSNQSPIGSLWKPDRNNFAPRLGFAWDVNGDGQTSIRGGYGIGYERNFGNVTYNVLFNPPDYLVATIDSLADVESQPIYVDNGGPFAGAAGVRKTIPSGSLRHVDQNIKTANAYLYGMSFETQLSSGVTGAVEYNGSSGRDLYDLADTNKAGAPLVYEGVGTPTSRPNPLYSAFNTRGNRGRSQYHGVVFSVDARSVGDTGLALTTKYTLSQSKDNLSGTFSDADNNGYFNLGYLDAFDPMLDYGYSGFDVRHRLSVGAIWNVPWGGTRTWAGGWQINGVLTARSGYPFSIFDCANGAFFCMRAIDTANIGRNATDGPATGNPNEFMLLDLAPILGAVGSYVNPKTGNSDFGPYPSTMTERDAFRGPGAWNVDFIIGKRFHFGSRQAALIRLEAYNLFNHHNMFARTEAADVSSATMITGYRDGHRRMQLGFKLEF